MSTTIDNRVVEMRFDNKQFEKNVQQSMSTLDKLKQKLNLSGAAKGLENINASASKVNMDGLSKGIEACHSKFSALEVMGITALANITNSAVEAGKRMINALTVAPIGDGWQEYEMTLNAIQTTMAGTGKTAEQVSEQLKLLDIYADKTVYSTADMLNNLPKFTNAGVALEDATTAMIGIANATALAGGDANKASIAFYNLGQAIGTGYLTRMDYNSINNAGIATMEWKNQMVEAAIAAGTLKEVEEGLYSAGGDAMTINQLFIDGLKDQWATTEVMMKVFKDYGDETTEIGKKSYAAAQDIKTFTMMMDSLKATAGTGWKDTWEIIFGDLDEAKEFWTGLTNFISSIITGMADARNKLLEGALGRGFKKLGKTLSTITSPIKKTADSVKKVTSALKDLNTMVNEVILGKWGNGEERFQALTKAGYNYYAIQNKVNETLGDAFRYSDELVNSHNKLNKTQETSAETQEKLTKAQAKSIEMLAGMSEAELKAAGYTEEQIEALKELRKYAKMTGLSIREFIEHIDEIDGRWLLINSFRNAGKGLVAVFKALKDAWVEIFPPMTSDQLFRIIAGLHKFSTHLVVSEETADKLKRTLKGVFAILDMALTIVTGPLKIAGKILIEFLQLLGLIPHDFLGITAAIGDAIVAVRDWLDSVLDLSAVFEFLAPYVIKAADATRDWFKSLGQSEAVKKFAEYLRNAKEAIVDWFKGLKEADNIPKYIFEGLINGLSSGLKSVTEFVVNVGKQIIASIKKVLGIHSPSTEFFEIGQNIMQGLFNGIGSFVNMIYSLIMSIGSKLINIIQDLDIGSIFTILAGTGFVIGFVKIAKALDALTSPLETLDDVLVQVKKTVRDFRGVLKTFKLKIVAESIKSMAIAVAILAGSVVALTMVDQGKMWSAVGAIGVLMGLLAGLTAIAGKFGGTKSVEFGKIALSLVGLAFAMGIMAKALKTIGSIDSDKYLQALSGLVTIMITMMGMIYVVGTKGSQFTKLGGTFVGMAFALLMMAMVTKMLGKMDPKVLTQGTAAIIAFGGIVVGLMAATKLLVGSKNVENIGKTIFKISTAILMMLIVAKMAGKMDREELIQGTLAIAAFGGIVVGLMAATKLLTGSKNVTNIGKSIFKISTAILMMLIVAKMAARMEPAEILKGVLAITAFSGIIVGLMAATKLLGGSKNVAKIGKYLLMISFAIAAMGVTAAVLSLIDPAGLAKGIIAVGLLSVMVMGLIAVTKNAKSITGTIIAISAAIGVMAIALGVLSIIDPVKLAGATLAISTILGMFALVINFTGHAKNVMSTIIALTVAIGLLGAALFLVATLPAAQSLAAAASLSILLITLTGALVIISTTGPIAYASVGAIALLTLVMAGLAGVLLLMTKLGVENAMTNALALSALIIAMSASLVALGIVGLMGPAAFIGIGALATLIAAMVGLTVGIGALMEKIPSLQGFLSTGVAVLKKVAGGIGEAIGAFVGGIFTGVSEALPNIATNLSKFMTNLEPFIAGAKTIDTKALAGIGIIAACVVALTAAEFINGIASFLNGGKSFSTLGSELSAFMTNAMPFIILGKQVDPSIMKGIKTLAEAIFILTGADLLQGISSWLTGGNSLSNFGSQLGGLGTDLNDFATNLGSFDESKVNTVNCACRAIKALAEAASEIPNEGGLWAKIAGENSLAAFGEQLPKIGTNINGFINNLGTFDESKLTTVDCAGRAIKALAEAAGEIPNEDGLWAKIAGDNSLATFGAQLPKIGTNLNGFLTNLGTFDESKITTVDCACKAIKAIATAASEIPNEDGLWARIVGDNSLATFGAQLPKLGAYMASFVSYLGTFNENQVTTINSACKAIKTIAKLGEIDIKDTGSDLHSLGKNMVKFAKKIRTFVDEIGETSSDGIDSAIKKTNDLIDMAKSVASTNVESLKTFGKSLKKIAKDGVKGFVEEFDGKSPKSDAEKGAKELVQAAIDGIGNKNKKSDLKNAAKKLAQAAIDAMHSKSLKNDAESAGKDLCQGLINGLNNSDKRAQVYNAAYSLGELAVQGEKDGQKSNSPSKATEQAGRWLGEGLVIGIKKMGSRVYGAGKTMGTEATNSISSALNTALNLLDSDMDAQPTIRPVLDLSDVESGAGYLNSLFNNGPSIGVTSNLKAINSGMNDRNQNRNNNEVVSAINKLGKDLNKSGGTTNNYNVNGVKYDDESTVADAVRTLVRAAIMEGRI